MSRNRLIAVAVGVAFVALLGWSMTRYTCDGMNEADAKLKMSEIDRALAAYKMSHGEYPESLKELTLPEDDKRAPLDAMGIVDPWGGTFRYDPSNCQPETGRPRISTVTPDGTELSNW